MTITTAAAAPLWRGLGLPADPLTWTSDDLACFIAGISSIAIDDARQMVCAVIVNHQLSRQQVWIGGLFLDAETHEVMHGGREIALTPIEFRLLYILAVNANRVVSHNRLVDYAYGIDEGSVAVLKTHISHIRRKLDLPQDDISDIRAIVKVGYRLSGTFERGARKDG